MTFSFSFYDLFEFLHHPWHRYDLVMVVTMLVWTLLIKVPVFLLINFNKKMPLVFNKKRSKFILWLLYSAMALISLSNLLGSYIHGCGVEMLIAKSIVVITILIWDFQETKEAIKKLDDTDKEL